MANNNSDSGGCGLGIAKTGGIIALVFMGIGRNADNLFRGCARVSDDVFSSARRIPTSTWDDIPSYNPAKYSDDIKPITTPSIKPQESTDDIFRSIEEDLLITSEPKVAQREATENFIDQLELSA